ncbi:hypothetical protein B7486_16780 [cyanobacterium TDX16]|nr:hypothetical protein B7486_16780 [cyanobacterium TDX16]
MYFVVIMAFALVLSNDLPTPGLDLFSGRDPADRSVTLAVLAIALGQVLLVAGAALLLRREVVNRLSGPSADHDEAVRRFSRAQTWLVGMISVALVVTMVCTPWARLIRDTWDLDRFPLVGDLFLLLPFFASLTLVWTIWYSAELRLKYASLAPASGEQPVDRERKGTPDESLGSYLFDKYRHQILVIAAPMIFIVFAKHYTEQYRMSLFKSTGLPWLSDAILGAASILVLVAAPIMLRYLWSTEPLAAGPLRDRFEQICERIGLRYREILLWRTHGLTVNAAVMGFIPQIRYVLVSDALVESMKDEEIEAVFGHEAGHVKHLHLPFFGAFAALSMYVSGGIVVLLQVTNVVKDSGVLQMAGLVALMITWLFGFGWLSRRFERQADLFGVRCVTPDVTSCRAWCPVHGDAKTSGICISATQLFGKTLMKIAALNGIPRSAPSWRHGSIESRCRLLERLAASPSECARFDRSLLRIKIGLAVCTVVGTIGAAAFYYDGVARALGWK